MPILEEKEEEIILSAINSLYLNVALQGCNDTPTDYPDREVTRERS